MTDDSILETLQVVFRDVFDRPDLQITPETDAADIEGWDSLMHINLIVAIEERLGIAFTTVEIGSFACVGDVADLVAGKTKA